MRTLIQFEMVKLSILANLHQSLLYSSVYFPFILFEQSQDIWLCLEPWAIYKEESAGVWGLAMRCLNIGQEEAQCTGPSATRLCPEYTLWAQQQASGTCSAAGQIKALITRLTRALLGSLAQEVAETPLSILFLLLSLPLWLMLMATRDISGRPCATEQNASVPKLWRQKTSQAGLMRLLWVAVFHYSSKCIAIILVVGWRAACWSHLREAPLVCQRSWSEWEGNNVYCCIFCFLSLYFKSFFHLLLVPCDVHLFKSAGCTLPSPRCSMSFTTCLRQSHQ